MIGINKKHILIIEDSKDLQDLLGSLFEEEGFTVSQAFNGQEALDLLKSMPKPPCIILLDIMMPVMDGLEFRREQRKDTLLNSIPVIVLTADSEPQAKAAQMEIKHLFVKPIQDINKLLELVAKLCN